MTDSSRGRPVRFSAVGNLSTATAVSIFDINGNAVTLVSTEFLVILDWQVACNQTALIQLIDDVDDVGDADPEDILANIQHVLGQVSSSHAVFGGEGKSGGRGRTPKVLSSSTGVCNVSGNAYILKA